MKYFVIADVHGFYDEMLKALDEKGFDRNNPNHTLISLGDAMDRGKKPLEVINYLLSLERKILIRGNHEDLLYELLTYRYPMMHDVHNGTLETFIRLAKASGVELSSDEIIDNFSNSRYLAKQTPIMDYFDSLVNNAHIGKYYFVHGWLPYRYNDDGNIILEIDSEDPAILKESRWVSGVKMLEEGVVVPGETIVCGHWHSCLFHERFNGCAHNKVFTPFVAPGIIAIDAATALSGIVNCIVIDDDGSVII